MSALIVGYGRAGQRHAQLLRSQCGVRTIAVVDGDQKKREIASSAGDTSFGNLRMAIRVSQPEFAIVATPPAFHIRIAEAIVALGIPCLVEKPIASSEQSLAILYRAIENGVPVSVISQHRFAPDFPALAQRLMNGSRGSLFIRRRRSEQYLRVAGADATDSSGIAFTIGIHWFDLFYSVLGRPIAIHVSRSAKRHGAQTEVEASISWSTCEIYVDAGWGEDVDEQPDVLEIDGLLYSSDCLHEQSQRCLITNEFLILRQLEEFISFVRFSRPEILVKLQDAEGALQIASSLCR